VKEKLGVNNRYFQEAIVEISTGTNEMNFGERIGNFLYF